MMQANNQKVSNGVNLRSIGQIFKSAKIVLGDDIWDILGRSRIEDFWRKQQGTLWQETKPQNFTGNNKHFVPLKLFVAPV